MGAAKPVLLMPVWAYSGRSTVDIGHFHVSAIAHQSVQGVHQSPFLSSAQRFHVSPHLHISTACRGSTLIQALLATIFPGTSVRHPAKSVHTSCTPRLGVTIYRGARVPNTPEGEWEDTVATPGPLVIMSTVAPVFHRLVGMLEKELASLGFDQVANSGLAFNF